MVGGSRSTRREPTHTRGEHANSTQKGHKRGSNLEPSHCEATVLTTTPPCSSYANIFREIPVRRRVKWIISNFIEHSVRVPLTYTEALNPLNSSGSPAGQHLFSTQLHWEHKYCVSVVEHAAYCWRAEVLWFDHHSEYNLFSVTRVLTIQFCSTCKPPKILSLFFPKKLMLHYKSACVKY